MRGIREAVESLGLENSQEENNQCLLCSYDAPGPFSALYKY